MNKNVGIRLHKAWHIVALAAVLAGFSLLYIYTGNTDLWLAAAGGLSAGALTYAGAVLSVFIHSLFWRRE